MTEWRIENRVEYRVFGFFEREKMLEVGFDGIYLEVMMKRDEGLLYGFCVIFEENYELLIN
jgi:hypothetical protein